MGDEITRDQFAARLVDLCLTSGLTGFPRKRRDRHILLKSVVLTMDEARVYTVAEVDDRLIYWLTDIGRSIRFDHVSLRRLLVDEGYVHRDRAGSAYRAGPEGSGEVAFEAEVDELDVYQVIGVGMKAVDDRRRRYSERR